MWFADAGALLCNKPGLYHEKFISAYTGRVIISGTTQYNMRNGIHAFMLYRWVFYTGKKQNFACLVKNSWRNNHDKFEIEKTLNQFHPLLC